MCISCKVFITFGGKIVCHKLKSSYLVRYLMLIGHKTSYVTSLILFYYAFATRRPSGGNRHASRGDLAAVLVARESATAATAFP